jgi:hypothetical protein
MSMLETVKELVGFLARWCLLALAAACVPVVGWAAMGAGSAAVRSGDLQVVLSDEIWRQSGSSQGMYVTGYFLGSASTQSTGPVSAGSQLFCVVPGFNPTRVEGDGRRFRAAVPYRPDSPATSQPCQVRLKGTPYGWAAFIHAEAICKVIPPGRSVLAVDARLVPAGLPGQDQLSQEQISQLESRGELVVFFPQAEDESLQRQAERYLRFREGFRRRWPQIPVVFSPSEKSPRQKDDVLDPIAVLRHVAETLRPPAGSRPTVVTADRRLAGAAAARGFPTHLIDPSASQAALSE